MVMVALSYEHDDDLEPESVLLIVDGSANGERVQFVVDTGARMSNVPDVGVITKLPSVGTDTGLGASATSSGDDLVIIDELTIGELTTHTVQTCRSIPTRRPLLGIDILGAHRCHFRFSVDQLEFDESAQPQHGDRELTRQANGSPLVDVDFGSVVVQACWDTGASLTVVDAQFARTHPQLVDTAGESSGFDAAGVPMSGTAGILSACRIGGHNFQQSACIILDLEPLNETLDSPLEIIVGMPLARRADWLFDFPNNRWHVTPH